MLVFHSMLDLQILLPMDHCKTTDFPIHDDTVSVAHQLGSIACHILFYDMLFDRRR